MDLSTLSLSQIASGLREKRFTARDLFTAAADSYHGSEERLNAYKAWGGEAAAKQAQAADLLFQSGIDLGPLMGIPVSVKDVFGVPGLPVYAGSSSELPREWQTPGPVVTAMQRQLAIVVGKTHTVEFAFGGLGFNTHWGTPLNPWSLDIPRAPGGSSSGAGVSLAQGSAFVALGTDTSGSIRIPASMTGQVGLKLTVGRWSAHGIVPLSPSLDTPGLMCRSVQDIAYAFAALDPYVSTAPEPVQLPGLRIGVPVNLFWDDAEPGVASLIHAALAELTAHGARSHELVLPGCEEALTIFYEGGLAAPEFRAFMLARFPERIARLDPTVRRRVQGAENMTSDDYLHRLRALAHYGQEAMSGFAGCDVLLTPTVPISPPVMADLADIEKFHRANMMALRNTAVANLLGWCALTLPVGLDPNGMPVGLQLMAPPRQEERLIAAGLAVEGLLGEHFTPVRQMKNRARELVQQG